MANNTILFPHWEKVVRLTGEELLNELNNVTAMPIMPRCKLLVIDYLMKNYFAIDNEEEIPEKRFMS